MHRGNEDVRERYVLETLRDATGSYSPPNVEKPWLSGYEGQKCEARGEAARGTYEMQYVHEGTHE